MPDRRPVRVAVLSGLVASAIGVLAACTGGPGPGAGLSGTAAALAQTAQAGGQQAGTALAGAPGTASVLEATAKSVAATLAANVTQFAPTAQALVTQAGNLPGTAQALAGTAQAMATRINGDDASTFISQYAQEVLGTSVTIIRAGGLSADIDQQIKLPQDGEQAQASTADVAVQTYAAMLKGGAGSVSYGKGAVAGDINVDINSSSLGAFSLDTDGLPTAREDALALALQTFPGLASRSFIAYPVQVGFAWIAQGQVPGFDPQSLQATLISEDILLAVTPAGLRRSVVSAVVGKGDFAAEVIP